VGQLSNLIGTTAYVAGFVANTVTYNDDRLQPREYKTLGVSDFIAHDRMDFADILWPRSQGISGCAESQVPLINPDSAAQMWEWNVHATGGRHRAVFTGVTLSATSGPIGGVTVNLYNTATGLLVDTQVSDSGGNFKVTDPNGVQCYMVAYLPGSPDICGTTINELIGV
jgi:hypothetical protein